MNIIRQYIENIIRSLDFEITDGLWIVWLAAVVLLVLSVFFFIAVLISRYRKDYISAWELSFNQKVEPLLLALIYGGYPTFEDWKAASTFNQFEKRYLRRKRGKKLFIKTISVLRSRLSGEESARLAEVYRKAGFYKTSLADLENRRWHVKAAAIHQLGALNYVQAVPIIKKLADHPHEEVRSMAQLALIQLDDSDPLGFLDHLKNPISKNAMIRLHGALLQKSSLDIKTLDRWLKSKNPDVVWFAATMAGLFNAATDIPLLAQLVNHPFLNIAKAAIISLEQLGAQETLTEQIAELTTAAPEIQIQLIKSLGSLGFSNEKAIWQWLQHDDFDVVLAAYNCYAGFASPETIQAALAKFPSRDHLAEIVAQQAHFKQIQLS